jgi:hypothetical protein
MDALASRNGVERIAWTRANMPLLAALSRDPSTQIDPARGGADRDLRDRRLPAAEQRCRERDGASRITA